MIPRVEPEGILFGKPLHTFPDHALVRQTEQMRAFHEFVCNRWDQSDIQEKAIPEARFEFECPPNNQASLFQTPGERQCDGLKDIKCAEPSIRLYGIGKVRRRLIIVCLVDCRQSQRVMGFIRE